MSNDTYGTVISLCPAAILQASQTQLYMANYSTIPKTHFCPPFLNKNWYPEA